MKINCGDTRTLRAVFSSLFDFLVITMFSFYARKHVIRKIVPPFWSTLMYVCEAWTIRKKMERRLEAAEMWFYRRMMRIPWTARVANVEVLRKAGVGRCLMRKIWRRQLKFLGYIVGAQELESGFLLGRTDSTRASGRLKTYTDSILSYVGGGQTTAGLFRMARDREDWRSLVDNVKRQSPW